MNNDKLPATDSEPAAAERETASRRAVGVYDRPAQRAGLSRPLLVIMILAALVSVIVTARFLF